MYQGQRWDGGELPRTSAGALGWGPVSSWLIRLCNQGPIARPSGCRCTFEAPLEIQLPASEIQTGQYDAGHSRRETATG